MTKRFVSENVDWVRCMRAYGPSVSHCAGDRLIVSGYICPHCDSNNPSEECHAPAVASSVATVVNEETSR